MEINYRNYLDTTTMLTVSSNTSSAGTLFNPDPVFQYVTTGFNNDLTTASIRISFSQTLSVSRIALLEHNLKDYRLYYNGVTSNTFAFTTADTSASNFSSNSKTSQFFRATPVNCTSVSIDMRKTITADQEKAIGVLFVSDILLDFSLIPQAKNYDPRVIPKQVVHILSDGGTRVHNVSKKFEAKIKLSRIGETFRNSLRTIYNLRDSFEFVPFGTSTGWDGVMFECVWPGSFDFFQYSDNAVSAGFDGNILLKEVPF